MLPPATANTPSSPCLTQDASMCVSKRSRREARRVHVHLPGNTPPSPSIQLTRLHDPACSTGFGETCASAYPYETCAPTYPYETCASTRHMSITHTPLAHTCASPTPFYPSLPREREREEDRERRIDLGWGGRRRSWGTCVWPRMRAALLTTTSYCRYLYINI